MKHIKIVITGGPSGGKTTLIEAVKKELGNSISVVPEAASILYRGGFPRLKSKEAQIHTQLAIYHTQAHLEQIIDSQNKKTRALVCDRGSLDGVAYWAEHKNTFFKKIKSSEAKEISRYDWVIHLDTASKLFYDTSNVIRTETFEEARRLNNKIKKAWSHHPRRFVIEESDDFMSKMTLSLCVIRSILAGKSYQYIHQELLNGEH